MIEIDRLSKVFRSSDGDDVVALEDVSLNVADNEFVTIVGPSGCGKSTLLRLASGLIKPTSGSATIDGTMVEEPREDTKAEEPRGNQQGRSNCPPGRGPMGELSPRGRSNGRIVPLGKVQWENCPPVRL